MMAAQRAEIRLLIFASLGVRSRKSASRENKIAQTANTATKRATVMRIIKCYVRTKSIFLPI